MLAQSQLRPTARGSPLIRLRFDLRLPLAASLVCVLLAAVPVSAHPRAQFPVQSVGDRGTDVTAVQHLLRARGHSTPVTGLFSTVTREAGPVKGGSTVIAFVQDPDGYKIEFIERKGKA